MFDEDENMGAPLSVGGGLRGPTTEGSLRDAMWSLHEAKRHLRTVACQASDEEMRSDARVAIAAIGAILRDVLKEPDD